MFAGYQIQIADPIERARFVAQLRADAGHPVMVLDTCQRLEIFGNLRPEQFPKLETLPAGSVVIEKKYACRDAFERLSRIATGLESRVLGELEVLGQVRSAYKEFNEAFGNDKPTKNGLSESNAGVTDQIFQEVLALARKARKASGIDKHLTSLSGLTAREMLNRVAPGTPIAVIGSGSLAQSIVRYLGKRGKSPIRVAGRCPDKAMTLAMQAGGFGAGLDELAHMLEGVGGIITATAAPHPVLFDQHFAQHVNDEPQTSEGMLHVIDLGVPPDCCETVINHKRVSYMKLEDVEAKSLANQQERIECGELATKIIREGADVWCKAHPFCAN